MDKITNILKSKLGNSKPTNQIQEVQKHNQKLAELANQLLKFMDTTTISDYKVNLGNVSENNLSNNKKVEFFNTLGPEKINELFRFLINNNKSIIVVANIQFVKNLSDGYRYTEEDELKQQKWKKFKLESDITNKLFEQGYENAILRNLNLFEGVDLNLLVQKIIDKGQEGLVLDNLYRLPSNSINAENMHRLADYKLPKKDSKEEKPKTGAEIILKSSNQFEIIDDYVVTELINQGKLETVFKDLRYYQKNTIDWNLLIQNAIKTNQTKVLMDDLSRLETDKINSANTHQLVDLGYGQTILNYSHKFGSLDTYVAAKLIEEGLADQLLEKIYSFHNLEPSIATMIVDALVNNGFEAIKRHDSRFTSFSLDFIERYIQSGKDSPTYFLQQNIDMLYKAGVTNMDLVHLSKKYPDQFPINDVISRMKNLDNNIVNFALNDPTIEKSEFVSDVSKFDKLEPRLLNTIIKTLVDNSSKNSESSTLTEYDTKQFIEKQQITTKEFFDLLLFHKGFNIILSSARSFPDADVNFIANQILLQDGLWECVNLGGYNLEALMVRGFDMESYLDKVLEKVETTHSFYKLTGLISEARNIQNMKLLSKDLFYRLVLKFPKEMVNRFANHNTILDSFVQLDKANLIFFVSKIVEFRNNNDGRIITNEHFEHIIQTQKITSMELSKYVIESGGYDLILSHIDAFPQINLDSLIEQLLLRKDLWKKVNLKKENLKDLITRGFDFENYCSKILEVVDDDSKNDLIRLFSDWQSLNGNAPLTKNLFNKFLHKDSSIAIKILNAFEQLGNDELKYILDNYQAAFNNDNNLKFVFLFKSLSKFENINENNKKLLIVQMLEHEYMNIRIVVKSNELNEFIKQLNLTLDKLLDLLLEYKGFDIIINNFELFPKINTNIIINQLLNNDENDIDAISNNLEKLIGLGLNFSECVNKVFDITDHNKMFRKIETLLRSYKKLPNTKQLLNKDIFRRFIDRTLNGRTSEYIIQLVPIFELLESSDLNTILNLAKKTVTSSNELPNFRQFSIKLDSAKEIVNNCKSTYPQYCATINAAFHNKPDPILGRLYSTFGDFLNQANYNDMIQLLNAESIDQIPFSILQTKICTQPGEAGLQELESAFANLKDEIISDKAFSDETLDKLKNQLFAPYFKNLISYETSSFGGHGDAEFIRTLDNYKIFRDSQVTKESTDNPPPNNLIQLETSDWAPIIKVKENFVEVTEDVASAVNKLNKSFDEATALVTPTETPKLVDPIKIKEDFHESLNTLVERKTEQLSNQKNDKAIKNLQKQIDDLKKISGWSLKHCLRNITEFFAIAASHDELHQILRTLLFVYTLKKQPGSRNLLDQISDNQVLDRTKTSNIIDFVTHFTKEETWHKLLDKKSKARDKVRSLLNIKSLNQHLKRIKSKEKQSDETVDIQFLPCRNPLTEFSGHIADACWASKHDSILKQFPNFTSVMIIKKDKDRGIKSLQGAFFVIQSTVTEEDKTGNKVQKPILIIRGLNPRETFINQLDVAHFFDTIVNYVKVIADKNNSKVGVVIDTGHTNAGGADTNRPKLFAEIHQRLSSLQQTKVPETDTTFNGYDISNMVFEIV